MPQYFSALQTANNESIFLVYYNLPPETLTSSCRLLNAQFSNVNLFVFVAKCSLEFMENTVLRLYRTTILKKIRFEKLVTVLF